MIHTSPYPSIHRENLQGFKFGPLFMAFLAPNFLIDMHKSKILKQTLHILKCICYEE